MTGILASSLLYLVYFLFVALGFTSVIIQFLETKRDNVIPFTAKAKNRKAA
jgi:hypothetical protein